MRSKVAQSHFDPTRPHMHRVINPKPQKLLDLGCGAGAFGQSIKELSNAIVWGVERNHFLADYAARKLDRVIRGKIADAVSALPDNYFDTITFDALEREKNPHQILKIMREKLAPGGEIVVSAINLRQWPVIRDLLEGHWDYEYYGILEKDHYRFFTRNSLENLLTNSGYKVVYLSSQFLLNNYTEVPENVLDALSRTEVDTSSLKEDSSTFRYTIKGIKPSLEKTEHHTYARSLLKLRKYEQARKHYLSMKSKNPYSLEILYRLAQCSLRMKNYRNAFEEFKTLLEIQPDYAPGLNQLALLHIRFGNLQAAESMLLKAIMNAPRQIQFQVNYGQVLMALEKHDMAELVFQNIQNNQGNCFWAGKYINIFLTQIRNSSLETNRSFAPFEILDIDPDNENLAECSENTHVTILIPNKNPKNPHGTALKKERFFLNSIAKGGTNLLTKVLGLFPGIVQSDVVLSRGARLEDLPLGGYGSLKVGRDGYLGKPSVWNCERDIPIDADSPHLEKLEKIFFLLTTLPDGTFATGHIPFSKAFADLLMRMKMKSFLILRDPRDVVVSHAFFVSQNPYNEYFRLYRHLSVDEQIMTSIIGIRGNNYPGLTLVDIGERLQSLLPWQNNPDTCTVFFEQLVGPKGAGAFELQVKTLQKIAEHLQIPLPQRELEAMAVKVFGGSQTFRKGTIGSWKTYLKEEHKAAMKALAGPQIISLGYERNNEW